MERLSRVTPGPNVEEPDLVKEVIPGNDIENVGPFPDIWSVEPFVSTLADGARATHITNEPSRVTEP